MWKLILGFLIVTASHCSEDKSGKWAYLDYGTNCIQEPDVESLERGRRAREIQCSCGSCFNCLKKTKKIACEGEVPVCQSKSKGEIWGIAAGTVILGLVTWACLEKLKHVNDNNNG